jgi:SNF2 family DNA or RNA helicase
MNSLFKFQEDGVEILRETKRMILGDDMGVGKTPQLICANRDGRRIIVSCPSTVRSVWERELPKWGEDNFVILRKPKDVNLITPTTKWIVCNHESLRIHRLDALGRKVDDKGRYTENKKKYEGQSPFKTVASTEIGATLFKLGHDRFVLDEAHLMANNKAGWTKGALILAKAAERVYPATGTPMVSVESLWTLLNMVAPNVFRSKWKFLQKHADAKPGVFGWEKNRHATDPQALADEIRPYFLRREKRDVFKDMPPRTVQDVYLDPTDQQTSINESIKNDLLIEIGDDFIMTPSTITQMVRLQQVSIDPRILGIKSAGSKIGYTVDLIQGTTQKVVVFCTFAEALSLLSQELDKEGVKHHKMTGDTEDTERTRMIEDFQTNPDIRSFITTTQAGGPGIDLTAGTIAVFINRHYTPSINLQAEARIDRYPQDKPITIINLRTTGSIDDHAYDALSDKEHAAKSVLDILKSFIKS